MKTLIDLKNKRRKLRMKQKSGKKKIQGGKRK